MNFKQVLSVPKVSRPFVSGAAFKAAFPVTNSRADGANRNEENVTTANDTQGRKRRRRRADQETGMSAICDDRMVLIPHGKRKSQRRIETESLQRQTRDKNAVT